jgi:DNA topoisomerase-1
MTRLVIVESPAKARTIAGYLGRDFVVESSVGHIRDLPKRASDVKKEDKPRFGTLGVDVEHGFEPLYVVDADKKRVVTDLRKKLASSDELLLATDEDREGEAIAWHLREVLKPKVPVRRMVFHEITKDAIERALSETRDIDERLVDAQETRRILDRLYGFEVSPVLWKKVMPRLSAGRVQSVATRLVVDRERERMAFVVARYWDVLGTFEPGAFEARLVAVRTGDGPGSRVAQGRDFRPDGTPQTRDVVVLDEARARQLATGLDGRSFAVEKVDEKPYTRRPAAPFRTSTLQQEASRKLRFSSQTTMRLAQRLYENGHITYMRTDSVTLSDTALTAARAHAARVYGPETVPDKPRRYERAVANAQEAHEAIRPAGDVFRAPDELRGELSRDEQALYELIFKRTVASQMKDASGQTVSIELGATTADETRTTFRASGTVITFKGFLLAYESSRDEPTEGDEERILPALAVGQELSASALEAVGHETSPPARYTEASLVKALEDRGIGRPSTYASIMGTILDRGYVFKKGTALVPTFLAFAVTQLLERHFDRLVDYDFTARLEDDLDRIAAGDEERVEWLGRFYFGDGDPGLHSLVTDHLEGIDAREVNSIRIPGSDVVVRVGRYGPYLERGEQRASVPDDTAPDELTAERAEELLSRPAGGERPLGTHPETGLEIVARDGRYGPYVTEVLPEGADGKPHTASLFSSMALETLTLDDAVRLLTLPRTLEAPDGEEILVSNGRYGPFVKKGSETRSLESEDQLLSLTVDEAEAILATPKQRRGRGAPKPPLKELGPDPASGKPLVVKEGRFGPYVTDGETNASLKRGDDVEGLTLERALELLAERRAKGPSQPRRTTRSRR